MSEEKKDIEKPAEVVCEPVAGTAMKEVESETELDVDYDFLGRDFGYAGTLEELELALDEADSERNDSSKWISSVEFHTRLENKYPWLR